MQQRIIRSARFCVVPIGMTLAEGSAPAVLAGQSNRNVFQQERSKRQRFGKSPIIRTTRLKNLPAPIDQHPFHFRQNVKPFRNAREPIDNRAQHLLANRGRLRFGAVFRLKDRGRFLEFSLLARFLLFQRFDVFERHLEPELKLGLERSGVVLSKHTAIEQLPFIDLSDRWPLINPGVEIRLGKARFIYFLVAVFAVAIHVDDKVPSEFLAKIERHFSDELQGEWIFAVHVKDGNLDHLGDIGCIHR